jgi:hypothetical protein
MPSAVTSETMAKGKGKQGKGKQAKTDDFASSLYWDSVKENPGRKRQGVKVKTTAHADNDLRAAVEAGSYGEKHSSICPRQ